MANVKPSQQCPICGSVQPLSSKTCALCGARLTGKPTPVVATPANGKARFGSRLTYDPSQGDDDLYAGELAGRMWRWLLVVGIVLALGMGIGIGIVLGRGGADDGEPSSQAQFVPTDTIQPSLAPANTPDGAAPAFVTNTPNGSLIVAPTRTALPFATVTPAPPTLTPSPTEGPCMRTAAAGDTVLGMAMSCGHKDMAVVDVILELNNMTDAAQLREGQTLEIPWPTPTPGGETATPETEIGSDGGEANAPAATDQPAMNEFGTPDMLATYQNAEPTLRPGMAWHTVTEGEDIMGIAQYYGTTVDTLSKINKEIQFYQCDAGYDYGGPNCSVTIYIGQQIRVPVTLAPPTATPTPVGTLTPTPTATATFNAPFLISPADGASFSGDQMVVLRWGGTGTLRDNEWYYVRVRDLRTSEVYTAPVREQSYSLPGGWQPADGRRSHEFEWTISIVTLDAQYAVLTEEHLTQPRRFFWESR